ncbi:hypothetical protein GOM49_14435 [Clostridium bovifaecis]|uniref:Uncharacterized protein n=1 Tax=Clostridium bovifaecis TaxID=2184719 RepID=A0A6I6EUU4_9CLOT|nr:hypothetical protein GOM49_14435 [Clostridium bovifaecis]
MRNKLLYILIFSIFIAGCGKEIDKIQYVNKLSTIEVRGEVVSEILKVIDSNTTLKRGEIGYIIIQGKPRTRYTLQSSFRIGSKEQYVTQWRVTGGSGQATFNWVVDFETAPGTHDISITGNGEKIHLTHTVLP